MPARKLKFTWVEFRTIFECYFSELAADGHVGVLLVFDSDEIDMLLTTYFDGMDGHEGAQMAFGSWVSGVMGLLDSCITEAPPEG